MVAYQTVYLFAVYLCIHIFTRGAQILVKLSKKVNSYLHIVSELRENSVQMHKAMKRERALSKKAER